MNPNNVLAAMNVEANRKFVRKYLGLIALLISLVLAIVFFSFNLATSNALNGQLEIQGENFFHEIVNTRKWLASHGGVYVPLETSGGVNPYLEQLDGVRATIECGDQIYTLKNPALVTRELSESPEHDGQVIYKITSLRLINPKNAPDKFETESLRKFERGMTESRRFETINGKSYYRYMGSLKVVPACLKCHAHQDYKVGDIRGGIAVSILADEVKKDISRAQIWIVITGICVLLLVIFAIQFISRHFIRDLQKAHEMLCDMATTDFLTGLNNRLNGINLLNTEVARCKRFEEPLSVALLDIDHFKKVNDSYGHSAGDAVLKELARLIKECIREYDVACRYGGEEFLLIMPKTDLSQAIMVVERLLESVQAEPLKSGELEIPTSFSAGVAMLTDDESMDTLINRADTLLYEAKAAGRARVMG